MQDDQAPEEDIICFCEWLTREEIVKAIPRARNLRHLREITNACMTCFGCEGDLDDLVAEHEHEFGTAL